jgi:hypothetical protein
VKTLDATKAAENFTRFLDRVHSLQESFQIVKKGVPYAYLVPAVESGCNTLELAEDLAANELSSQDKRAMASAIRKGRKRLRPLKNPWA